MAFWRRTEAPSNLDLNFINVNYGGRNRCIRIASNGFVLPNCTGYVHGRFLEMYGESNLSIGNGEDYWGYNDGYSRGQTPKLGAVICWGGNPGETHGGHVAIVEKINYNSNGTIRNIETSNSAYGGPLWYTQTIAPPYNYPSSSRDYYFQGFIYPPGYIPPTPTTRTRSKFPWVLYARKLREKRSSY